MREISKRREILQVLRTPGKGSSGLVGRRTNPAAEPSQAVLPVVGDDAVAATLDGVKLRGSKPAAR